MQLVGKQSNTRTGEVEPRVIPGIKIDTAPINNHLRRNITTGAATLAVVGTALVAEQFAAPAIGNELVKIQHTLDQLIHNYQQTHINLPTPTTEPTKKPANQEVPPPANTIDRNQTIIVDINGGLTDEQYKELCLSGAHKVEIDGDAFVVETLTPDTQSHIVDSIESTSHGLTWTNNQIPDTTKYKFTVVPMPDTFLPEIKDSKYGVYINQSGVLELTSSHDSTLAIAYFNPNVITVTEANYNYDERLPQDEVNKLSMMVNGAWFTLDETVQNQVALTQAKIEGDIANENNMSAQPFAIDRHTFTFEPNQIIIVVQRSHAHYEQQGYGTPRDPNFKVDNSTIIYDDRGNEIYEQYAYSATVNNGSIVDIQFTKGHEGVTFAQMIYPPKYNGFVRFMGVVPPDYRQTIPPSVWATHHNGADAYQYMPYVWLVGPVTT